MRKTFIEGVFFFIITGDYIGLGERICGVSLFLLVLLLLIFFWKRGRGEGSR